MSFQIQIGTTKQPVKALDKNPSWSFTLDGTLRNKTSILSVDIIIRVGDSAGIHINELATCNYMYIERFKRYYFIDDVISLVNTTAEIKGHVDVWGTYKTQIRANTGIILKSASSYSKMLDDGSFKIYNNPWIVTKKLTGETFSKSPTFILAVSGS